MPLRVNVIKFFCVFNFKQVRNFWQESCFIQTVRQVKKRHDVHVFWGFQKRDFLVLHKTSVEPLKTTGDTSVEQFSPIFQKTAQNFNARI